MKKVRFKFELGPLRMKYESVAVVEPTGEIPPAVDPEFFDPPPKKSLECGFVELPPMLRCGIDAMNTSVLRACGFDIPDQGDGLWQTETRQAGITFFIGGFSGLLASDVARGYPIHGSALDIGIVPMDLALYAKSYAQRHNNPGQDLKIWMAAPLVSSRCEISWLALVSRPNLIETIPFGTLMGRIGSHGGMRF